MSCQVTSWRALKTFCSLHGHTHTHTHEMTTFNLSMELWQSPFYPEDRERDLLPLMEFKDCSVSDGEVMGSKRRHRGYRGRKGANAVVAWALVPLFKGFRLHHSSASQSGPTFNRLTSWGGGGGGGNAAKPSEDPRRRGVGVGVEAPVASEQTAIYGRWQFANISICTEALGVTMRSSVKLEESAAGIYFIRLFPMRCNCLTAWGLSENVP